MTIESIAAKGRGDEGRVQRAVDLYWDAAFERTSKSPEVWVVETTYGSINEVDLDRGTCSCEDSSGTRTSKSFAASTLFRQTSSPDGFGRTLVGFRAISEGRPRE